MVKKQQKRGVTNEKIFGLLVEMDERMSNMDNRIGNMDERITEIKETLVTKDDLERMKEEIIEPILRAVDKDAKTVFDHGKRISVLERHAGIIAK